MCVFSSIELRQFGFLLLWFVIFQPRKIKAFGYWLFLIKNTPKYKVKPMPPLKIYWLECSVHIIFSVLLVSSAVRTPDGNNRCSALINIPRLGRGSDVAGYMSTFSVSEGRDETTPCQLTVAGPLVVIQWQVHAPGDGFSDFPLFS